MERWIIEADIYRYKKQLQSIEQGVARQKLLECLRAAEERLALGRAALDARGD